MEDLPTIDAGANGPGASGPGASSPRVLVVAGADLGKVCVLSDSRVVVGRDLGCEFVLASEAVSRRHLQLECRGGKVWAEDLGSHNGAWRNGDKLKAGEAVALDHKDILVLADTKLIVLLSGESKQSLGTIFVDRAQVEREAADLLAEHFGLDAGIGDRKEAR